MLVMLRTETRGNEDFDFLSDEFATVIPEQCLGLGVDLHNRAVLRDGYDGVRDRLQKRTRQQNIA